ncbi:MAG: DUF1631 family protein [Hahellaceae bacterium]|jgi:hypothetical protein|nr:DUF1631 family protein [Hahellaceae bacterium]
MTSISPSEESRQITADELAEALLRVSLPEHGVLLKKIPPLSDSLTLERGEIARRLAEVGRDKPYSNEDLLNQIHGSLGGLDRVLVNCVLFMERAAQQWERISPLDVFVKSAFLRRRYVFAALLLDQPEFVLTPDHPIAQLLNRVEQLFMGWEEEKGQPPAFIMKALAALTHLLDADHCLNPAQQANALEVLTQEWERERKRREMLEKRLVDSELGLDQARYNQWLCTRLVNRTTSGFPLPPEIIQFLQGHWLDSLRLVLNEKGEDHAQFQEMRKLTEKLVFAFKPMQSEEEYNKLYNFAVKLVDQIGRNLLSLVHAPADMQIQLDLIEFLLMSVVKRTAEFNRELPTPLDLDLHINDTPFDEDAVKRMDGAWYRREGRICKVLAYLPRQRKVLWSDFAGRKAGVDDAAQVLADVNTKILAPFNDSTRMHAVFGAVAKAFVSLDKLERLRQRERLQKEKLARDEARAKAEAEAAAIQAAKAEAEARHARERLEAEERMRQAEVEAIERERIERLTAARAAIDGLKLGDPVTITRESGPVAATLAVRLTASQKLIFTDQIGLRIAEMHRDDAVQHFLDGTLIPGDKGGHNEAWRARFMGRMGVGRK